MNELEPAADAPQSGARSPEPAWDATGRDPARLLPGAFRAGTGPDGTAWPAGGSGA